MIQKTKDFIATNLTLLGIAIAGLLLRLWHLTSISLWHDEAFSVWLIRYPWGEMMHRIGLDVHPPMYYIFLRVWTYVFGQSVFSLRGLSVLFGVATIVITYYFVNYVFQNKKAALMAAALVAVNPFQIMYVTEARMYTMGAFFAVAATFALAAALRTQSLHYVTVANEVLRAQLKQRFIKYYLLFALSSAIMIYTHYYLLFTVAALGLYAIFYCIKNYKTEFTKYSWSLLSGILIALSFLPWLKEFLFQFRQVGAGYWIPPIDRWSIPNTLWDLLLKFERPTHWMIAIIAAFTIYIVIRAIWKLKQTEKWLVIAGFLAPFAGAILFAIMAHIQHETSSVYLVRYFIFCSTFYVILIALWLNNFKIRQIGMLFAAILILLNVYSVWNYWDNLQVQTKPGMAKASEFLTANVEPQHKLFIGNYYEFFNFKYYNQTSVKPLVYTYGKQVDGLHHYEGTALLTNDDLVPDFTKATTSGDTVWVLWTNGFEGSKPNVPENWVQIDEKGFAEVRPFVGTWIIVTEYKVN